MPKRSSKRSRDLNKLASEVVKESTREAKRTEPDGKDPAAVTLGRKGGFKGGKARAAKLSAAERSKAAKRAAQARWRSDGK